jgi:hypothetical protein
MAYSRDHFQLCRAYFDETEVHFESRKHFLWGSLLLPVDCDLGLRLGKLRKELGFLHTLHFSEGPKFNGQEKTFAEKALEIFLESSVCFRAIVASSNTWGKIDTLEGKARLAGQLLSYPWMPYEGKTYRFLSRSRVVFDRLSLNRIQEQRFLSAVNNMIGRPNRLPGATSYPIIDASVAFVDKSIFDELQLVDLIIGIIRVSYQLMAGEKPSSDKLKMHDMFRSKFPSLGSFVKANRSLTNDKINVWHFQPRKSS